MNAIGQFIRRHAAAYLAFLAVVLVMNATLVRNLGTHVIGRAADDAFEFLWIISWQGRALFEELTNPFFSEFIFYPQGWHLASSANTPWFMLAPAALGRLTGATAAYNLSLLLTLTAAGFGAYLLSFHFTGNRLASWAAGLAYMTAPIVTLRLWGHLNILIGIMWLPFFMIAFVKFMQSTEHKVRWALLSGLFLALAALAHWNFLFFAALPAVGLLLLWKPASPRTTILSFLCMAAVCLLIIAPFFLLTWNAQEQTFSTRPSFSQHDADIGSLSLLHLVTPNTIHGVWGLAAREYFPTQGEGDAVAIGYTTLLLVVVGIFAAPRREKAALLAMAAIALILALGGMLQWRREPVLVADSWPLVATISDSLLDETAVAEGSTPVALPGALLFRYLPFYNTLRFAARYAIPFMLALSALAAFGARAIILRYAFGRYLVLVLAGLIILEGWLLPYLAFTDVDQNRRPQLEAWLQSTPGETAVAEFPLPWINKAAMYNQSFHQRHTINGSMSKYPAHLTEVSDALGTWPSAPALPVLRAWDVDYVLISDPGAAQFDEEILPDLMATSGLCLEESFDEGLISYDQTYLFSVSEVDEPCP